MPERPLLKAQAKKMAAQSGTCAEIPTSGQRQRYGDRIQSECLYELTGAVSGDGWTDRRKGWWQLHQWACSARVGEHVYVCVCVFWGG